MWNKLTSMFQNSRGTKIAIVAFVVLLVLAFCTNSASAQNFSETRPFETFQEPSLSLTLGSAIIRQPAPVVGLTVNYPDVIGDIDYELGFELVGASDSVRNNFGVNLRLVDGWGPVRIGFGLAYLQHTDWINGSNLNFNLLAGYSISPRWTVDYSHWSNAGTTLPNLGRDMILIRYRFN